MPVALWLRRPSLPCLPLTLAASPHCLEWEHTRLIQTAAAPSHSIPILNYIHIASPVTTHDGHEPARSQQPRPRRSISP